MHPTRILKSPNHKRIVEFSLSPSISKITRVEFLEPPLMDVAQQCGGNA
jgi:hypothetical protein